MVLRRRPASCSDTLRVHSRQGRLASTQSPDACTLVYVCADLPHVQDHSRFTVVSTYNTTIYTIVSGLALAANIAVFGYMIYKVVKQKKILYQRYLHRYKEYKEIKALAEPVPAK